MDRKRKYMAPTMRVVKIGTRVLLAGSVTSTYGIDYGGVDVDGDGTPD